MFDLVDKVVLITGGASGIGEQVVRVLLEEKVKHVAFLDMAENLGVSLQNELRKKHGDKRVRFFKCDVTEDDQLKAAFKTTVDKFGYIDVVINNAGIARESIDEYKKEIEVNMTAVITSTLQAIQLMHKARGGRGGVVVNVSSIAALMQINCMSIYSGTKSGVLQFSSCIGNESYYSNTGVRVITICFGASDTPIFDKITLLEEDFMKDLKELMKNQTFQSALSAAKALIHACKHGKSASVWVSSQDQPAQDLTPVYKQAYALFEPYINIKI